MSKVTLPAAAENLIRLTQSITATENLKLIEGAYDSLTFGSTFRPDPNSGFYTLTVNGFFRAPESQLVEQLDAMINKRYLVMFKDNLNQTRYLANALLTYDQDTGNARGNASLPFVFTVASERQHRYYEAAYTENADGSISL